MPEPAAHQHARPAESSSRAAERAPAPPAPEQIQDGLGVAEFVPATPIKQLPVARTLTPRRVVSLQRAAGNRVVSSAVRSIAQRVAVKETVSETLYNQSGTGGKAGAKDYGLDAAYDNLRP